MAGSFKRIAAKSITNHTAHKEYDVQLVGGSGSFDGVSVFGYEGIYGKSEYTSGSEPLTTNGFTKRDIHSAVVAPFYRPKFTDNYKAPRGWDDTVQVISIPSLMSGEGIKPGSFTMTSGSISIIDDGEGRLIDSAYDGASTQLSQFATDRVFSANVSAHYDLYQQSRTIEEYTNKTYTQQARGKFYNVLNTSGTIEYNDPYSVHDNYTGSFLRITGTGGVTSADGQTELWRRTTQPSASFGWIDKLPRKIGNCSHWQGLTIIASFQPNDLFDPGNNEYRTLWQIGPADNAGSNPQNLFARLVYIPKTSGLGGALRLQTFKNGVESGLNMSTIIPNRHTGTVTVRISSTFSATVTVDNHTTGASQTQALAGFMSAADATIFNPEDRVISIGAGWANVDPDISQYDAVTAPDPIPKDKKLFAFGGFDLYRFDVWTDDIGPKTSNFYANYKSIQLGNIFYDEGIAAITSKIHTYDNFYKDASVGFKNTVNLTEHEYVCMISDREFNMSQNPSILSDDATAEHPTIKGFVTSSNWDPYITTIGLYDDDYTLMAIGKLGRPLRKVEHYDQTFVVRWDT